MPPPVTTKRPNLFACAGVALALLASPAAAQTGRSGRPAHGSKAQSKPKPKKPKAPAGKPASKPKSGPGPSGGTPAGAGPAAAKSAAPEAPLELRLSLQKVTLENGLRVVMNVDRTSPTVAVAVVYDVGSRNEEKGRSGFAHLFEHMMFQGSANVQRGEHFKLVSGHGGVLNGTTSTDRTNYFEVLPANELALGLWLEADRMKALDVSAENFENQRKVVQEEYRMRVSNAAYVPSAIRLEELVFQGYWPYEHSTIGSMADLDAAQLDWVKDFHAHHYGPNNAALVIAGDFEPDEAMAFVHRYFDAVPRVEVPPYQEPAFPEQTSQRTAIVKDLNARTPGVLYGWPVPSKREPDHYALDLAAIVLGDGESSRLHQLLVRDKGLAQSVSASTDGRRGPDLFAIDAKLADKAKVGDVEKAIEAEVKALATRPPGYEEPATAGGRAAAGLVLGLQSNLARAARLGEYEVFFGDAQLLNTEPARYQAVTKEDVQRAAAKYLVSTKRTIVETYPADSAAADKPHTPGGGVAPRGEKKADEAPHKAGDHKAAEHKSKDHDKGKGGAKKKPAAGKPGKKKKP